MIEVLIVIACLLGGMFIVGGCVFGPEIVDALVAKRTVKKEIAAGVHGMSLTSRQILLNYNSLPTDNRPFGDILPVLRALDTANDVGQVDYHFAARKYPFDIACWHPDESTICEFKDYREIALTLKRIKEAIAAREQALAMAGVVHELELVDALKDSLRSEENAILSATKELA